MRIHNAPRVRPYTLLYSTILKSRLYKLFRDISPDILHTHIPLPWAYVFGKVECAKIVTCHGSLEYPAPSYPVNFFLKRALKNADIVTAPSKWLAHYIEHQYNVSCLVIPNGVDTHVFAPTREVNQHNDVILYVGRFLERKGIRELIEAARALPEYEFWIVGSGGTGSIEAPSLPNLKLKGFVGDLVTCYNQASICVFPSYWENFPLVGLEAMACGRSIIATPKGFSEYVENEVDGLLVEPGHVDQLIQSIRYLMENEESRKNLEQNARKKSLQYDWGIVINQYRRLYEQIL